MTSCEIRPLAATDLPGLRRVVAATGLFPAEMVADLATPVLNAEPGVLGFSAHQGDAVIGLAYAMAEPMADRVWNMLALGVDPAQQGQGVGRALVAHLETALAGQARMILVDTSGTDGFAGARAFYAARGYHPVARIPDYWGDGDDKVTFRKGL